MHDDNGLYRETYRPQFHFTARKGWLNDPNGLVYFDGEYHLFYQHNPEDQNWGAMHWGHAVSDDLLHWTELPIALAPDNLGTMYSGSAVVDWFNTSGFQEGDKPPIVLIYTAAGGENTESSGQPYTQCLAYSNNRGRTWTKYSCNPALPHIIAQNRDPKVIWYPAQSVWIMALYLSGEEYALLSSPDLKQWTRLQSFTMSGAAECPDLFLLAIANDPQTQYWIFTGANGSYLVGQFDGDRFTRLEGPIHPEYGANFYAVQTFFDIPEKDGRRNERLSQQPSAYQDGKVADCEAISRESILLCTEPSAARHRSNVTKVQIAWMAGGIYPDMPFNQQMSIPCSLSLHRTADGIRMYRYPVQELQTLRRHKLIDSSSTLISGLDPLSDIHANLVDLEMELTYRTGGNLTFILRGTEITYDFDTLTLSCLGRSTLVEPIELNVDLLQQQAADVGSISTEGADSLIRPSTAGGESSVKMVKLRILLDKSSIEIFANAGAVSMSFAISPDENNSMLSCKLLGQPLDIKKLLVFALASVWN